MRLGDLTFELDGARLGRAGPHYDRALEVAGCLAPASEARLTAWLGAVDLGARRYDRAVARLDRALVLSPDDTRTRANHAVALERAGLRAEARAEWTRVAREARGTALGDAAAVRARRPAD